MSDAVADAFEKFEMRTRVPKEQVYRAKEIHPEITRAVKAHLGPLFSRCFLAGSYKRKVQTGPKLNDIDVIVVLHDRAGVFAGSAKAALDRLRQAADAIDLIAGTELGLRAVKCALEHEEFTVDLVAALEASEGQVQLARHDPEHGLDDWTAANPEGQTSASAKKNKETDEAYVPAVRMVKWWNEGHPVTLDGERKNLLPSYLVESILYHSMSVRKPYADVMVDFFDGAEKHLADPEPSVRCPGHPASYVDERLQDDRRLNALDQVRADLDRAKRAVAASDNEALDLWAEVFGPTFPSPSTDPAGALEALERGVGGASGAGIVARPGRQVASTRPWRNA